MIVHAVHSKVNRLITDGANGKRVNKKSIVDLSIRRSTLDSIDDVRFDRQSITDCRFCDSIVDYRLPSRFDCRSIGNPIESNDRIEDRQSVIDNRIFVAFGAPYSHCKKLASFPGSFVTSHARRSCMWSDSTHCCASPAGSAYHTTV